jgi:AbrB family looped-hinge helix DNA binding protein
MAKKSVKPSCCEPIGGKMACCKVEALISVDERGQMVLPKEMRDKADIHAGDKLALASWEKEGKVCCFILIKAGEFGDMVKGLLGPLMKEMTATDAVK